MSIVSIEMFWEANGVEIWPFSAPVRSVPFYEPFRGFPFRSSMHGKSFPVLLFRSTKRVQIRSVPCLDIP